jgi:VRR-NUC domain
MHAENSLCLTLFALICWDSINAATTTTTSNSNSSTSSNSSVYRTYRVAAPALWQPVTQLSPQVESICKQVEAGDAPLLIRRTWSQHYGELCTGLNWNLLSGRQQYQQQQQQGDDESDSTNAATTTNSDSGSDAVVDTAGAEPFCAIAECIGPSVLGAIVRTLAGNYWAWRHGLPDLFLWRHSSSTSNDDASNSSVSTGDNYSNNGNSSSTNTDSNSSSNSSSVRGSSSSNGDSGSSSTVHNSSSSSSNSSSSSASSASLCVFAEVKGPGDSLSHAQSAWIDKLLAAGATVELVKVEKAAGAFVQSTTSDVQSDYADDTAAAADDDEDDIDSGELD